MPKDTCLTCDKKSFCKVPDNLKPLCQNLEEYLKKTVDVKQREQPLKKGCETVNRIDWPATKSNEELIINMFFTEGKNQSQIARIIKVSHQYVNRIVCKYRKIIKQNISK